MKTQKKLGIWDGIINGRFDWLNPEPAVSITSEFTFNQKKKRWIEVKV